MQNGFYFSVAIYAFVGPPKMAGWLKDKNCLHPDVCEKIGVFERLREYLSAFCFWRHSGNSTRSLPWAVFVGPSVRKEQQARNAKWKGTLFKR